MTTKQTGDARADATSSSSDTQEGERHDEEASSTVGPTMEAEDTGHRADEAYVTLVISDDFAVGAEVMFHSLREHSRVRRPHVVLVTSDVSEEKREMLKSATDEIVEVRRRKMLSEICTQQQYIQGKTGSFAITVS